MKIAKIILAIVAVLVAVWLVYAILGAIVGIVFNLLWYAVVLALVGAGGYLAYKMLFKPKRPSLAERQTRLLDQSWLDQELERTDNLLQDYKNKTASEK